LTYLNNYVVINFSSLFILKKYLMKKILLLIFLMSAGIMVNAQETLVTGKVISSEDRLPIPGVSVIIVGTSIGDATDADGNFAINVPEGSNVLEFSFIGMETISIPIDGRTSFDVIMAPQDFVMNEIIVTAYGTSKKGSFTGSAAQVNSDKIESRPISNITKALEGAAPGIQVSSSDGQPGGGQDIRVRGFGSFSASSAPLYVVDGAPYYSGTSNLNPNDIESITVLKDAASTALYGNKAANGVVLITTKKGRNTKGQLTLNVSQGAVS
jgi:TonB-dependent SusC/RagA subfamily outer membrane receptor